MLVVVKTALMLYMMKIHSNNKSDHEIIVSASRYPVNVVWYLT